MAKKQSYSWKQLASNPVHLVIAIIVVLVAAPVAIPMIAGTLSAAVSTLAGPLLLAGIVIYVFKKMTK